MVIAGSGRGHWRLSGLPRCGFAPPRPWSSVGPSFGSTPHAPKRSRQSGDAHNSSSCLLNSASSSNSLLSFWRTSARSRHRCVEPEYNVEQTAYLEDPEGHQWLANHDDRKTSALDPPGRSGPRDQPMQRVHSCVPRDQAGSRASRSSRSSIARWVAGSAGWSSSDAAIIWRALTTATRRPAHEASSSLTAPS